MHRRDHKKRKKFHELIASGGGTKNPTLMNWLETELSGLGLRLRSSDEFGIPSEAKEAAAWLRHMLQE